MSSPLTTIQDTAIFEAAQQCGIIFNSLSPDTGTKNVLAEARTYHILREHHQRFQLWADFVGAFAEPEASLDARLKDHHEIHNLVLRLLALLKSNLARFVGIDDLSQGLPEPVVAAALDAIREAIERLQRLASVIRRSSLDSLASRVKAYALKQDPHEISEFERITLLYVKGRLQGISESLAKQVALSITFRRIRLLYVRRHQQKLATPRRDRPFTAPVVESSQSREELQTPTSQVQQQVHGPRLSLPQYATSQTNPSVLNQSRFLKEFKRPRSVPDNATVSLFGQGYSHPSSPKIEDDAGFCRCPWCACEIKASDLKRSGWWSSHFQRDLEPYVCISEECADNLAYFLKLSEWQRHMEEAHSTEWPRKIHNTVWYCDVEPEEYVEFPTGDKLRDHMETQHSTLPESRIVRKVARNVLRTDRNVNICPLCNQDALAVYALQSNMAEAASKGKAKAHNAHSGYALDGQDDQREPLENEQGTRVSQGEGTRNLRQESVDYQKLVKHIAQHMKSLAFLSIRYIDDDEVSVESDRAASGERGSEEEEGDDRLRNDFPVDEGPPQFEDIPPDLRSYKEISSGSVAPNSPLSQSSYDETFPITIQEFLENQEKYKFEWDSTGQETDEVWLEPVREVGLNPTKHKVFHHQNKEYLRSPHPFIQVGEQLGESGSTVVYRVNAPEGISDWGPLALKIIVCHSDNSPPGPDSTGRLHALQAVHKLSMISHHHIAVYVASFEDYCVSSRVRRLIGTRKQSAIVKNHQHIRKHILGVALYPPAQCNLRFYLSRVHEQPTETSPNVELRTFLCGYFGCIVRAMLYLFHSEVEMTPWDIHPSNILIDDFLMVSISDIGLTRPFSLNTRHSYPRPEVKRQYIPPEIDQSTIDRPDRVTMPGLVFSLGCIFLEMAIVLLGQHPDHARDYLARHGGGDRQLQPYFGHGYGATLRTGFKLDTYFNALHAKLDYTNQAIKPELFTLILEVLPTIGRMMEHDPSKRPDLKDLYPFFRHLYDVPGSEGRCQSCEKEWLQSTQGGQQD